MSTSTAPPEPSKLTFQYWTDLMCVWAFVSQSKLDRILDEWEGKVEVRGQGRLRHGG